MEAVQIRNLSHRFPTHRNSNQPKNVLDDVNLSVRSGEIYGLLGPNGGGKSTLFRIIATSLIPSSGDAEVLGQSVTRNPGAVRQKIGVVFQNPSLDQKLTVSENLMHQGHLHGLRGAALRDKIGHLLTSFRLAERANDFVEILSGGLKRRVEIAKGLVHEPTVLLMDEPSTGLDPVARQEMWQHVLELKKSGVTILLTTHLMEEGDQCDRLAILHRGKCVAMGTPTELKKKIGGDVVIIHGKELEQLAPKIQQKFGCSPTRVGETLRVEIQDGHKFIPPLIEAFPGQITSVSVGKPTLEDVFVHVTGQGFVDE